MLGGVKESEIGIEGKDFRGKRIARVTRTDMRQEQVCAPRSDWEP